MDLGIGKFKISRPNVNPKRASNEKLKFTDPKQNRSDSCNEDYSSENDEAEKKCCIPVQPIFQATGWGWDALDASTTTAVLKNQTLQQYYISLKQATKNL